MLHLSLVLTSCPDAPLIYWGVKAGEKDSISTNNYLIITIQLTSDRPEGNNINQLTRNAISSARAPLNKRNNSQETTQT
jgi:hypothetical protein